MRVFLDNKTLQTFFANVFSNKAQLINTVQNHYTIQGYTPKAIEIEGGLEIQINNQDLIQESKAQAKAIKAAEHGNYQKAIATLKPIITKGTLNSEAYRVYAQALIESGQSNGHDELIDALVRNPENEHALVLMGNHYANNGDNKTAKSFFNKALGVNPENVQALNNLGSILAKEEKYSDALRYFELAHEQQPDYANTYYGLALIYNHLGDYLQSFNWAIDGLKNGSDKSFLPRLIDLATESATQYAKVFNWQEAIEPFRKHLEEDSALPVCTTFDDTIATPARIDIAEYKGTVEHIVRYKQMSITVGHLVLHELCHLKYILEARTEDENYLFTSTNKHQKAFEQLAKPTRSLLAKSGLPQDRINGFIDSLFNGIVLQLYNAPIDLFIEQHIYDNFPEFRPVQFLSLKELMRDSINGPNSKDIQKLTPTIVFNANVAMSMTHAMLMQNLFAVPLLESFNQPRLIKTAENLYSQYLEMADDKEPGEEYDLIKWWGEDLQLTNFFELNKEAAKSTTQVDHLLSSIESDPTEALSSLPGKEQEMHKFLEQNTGDDVNMAVAMYMVSALEYFGKMPTVKVREVAHQIATIGMSGISPDKKNYSVPAFKGKTFTGYNLLAYYYVSWAIAEPQMLPKLQLLFDKEYEMAKMMIEKK